MAEAARWLTVLEEARGLLRLADSTVTRVARQPSAVVGLDELIGGGVPIGRIVEIYGAPSSGGTALVLALAASVTTRGGTVAWIDAFDALDPASMAAAGCDLDRVLWVRVEPGPHAPVLTPHAPVLTPHAPVLAPHAPVLAPHAPVLAPHPGPLPIRGEGDWSQSREGDWSRVPFESVNPSAAPRAMRRTSLRALDLVLSTDGFSLVVLDSIPSPGQRRFFVPDTTWVRVARTCEAHRTTLVVLGERPATGAQSILSLHGACTRLGIGELVARESRSITRADRPRRERAACSPDAHRAVDAPPRTGANAEDEAKTVMSTIAFARILDPPLAAWLRACPDWRHEPLVVLDVDEHVSPEARLRAAICSVSPEAAAFGIRPGHTGAQARSIAPEVRAVVRSIAQERAMVAALRDAAWSISPSIDLGDGKCPREINSNRTMNFHPPTGGENHHACLSFSHTGPNIGNGHLGDGGVYVDLSGLGRLHPTASDAAQALLRAARDVAVPIRVGVASAKPIALLASVHGDAPIANPSDAEIAFLAALPVESLSVWVPSLVPSGKTKARSDDAAALVASFGLTCLGDVAALPRGALAERLGREGELLESLARGEHRPPLEPAPPVVTIEEVLELEGHLETFEPLGFLLRPAIERLMGRLVLRGLGCAALELHLSLDSGGVDARTVTVSVPTRDVTALLALIRLSVDSRPPGAPVDGFRVVGHAGELRPTQLSLFAPAGPAPGALATTMARLSALVGPERVGSPRVPWTRRPGVVELSVFAPGPPPVIAEDSPERCPVRATRRVTPPLAVEVEIDARGRLCAVLLEGQRRSVVRVDGPFVVEGGWWSEEQYRREEHDVTLSPRSSFEGVLRVRLIRDSGAHYVDAVYDG